MPGDIQQGLCRFGGFSLEESLYNPANQGGPMNDATFGVVTWLIILAVIAVPIVIGVVVWQDRKAEQERRRRHFEETRVKPRR